MASKTRSRPERKKAGPNPLMDLGLFDIPNLDMEDSSGDDSDVDETNLEAELEALMRGEVPLKRNKIPPKPKVATPIDIEKIAAECLQDDEVEDDNENLSENEELLKELLMISPEMPVVEQEKEVPLPSSDTKDLFSGDSQPLHKTENSQSILTILQERLASYNAAINAAKSLNDTSKIRRYGRAVKTLENQIKSAKSGISINEEDIPPVVSIPKNSLSIPLEPTIKPVLKLSDSLSDDTKGSQSLNDEQLSLTPSLKDPIENASTVSFLIERRDQYKIAALRAKKAGSKDLAIKYMRIAKSFEAVIEAANNNQPVDLTNIPPPPPHLANADQNTQSVALEKSHEEVQTSSIEIAALAAANEDDASKIFAAPEAPTSVLEALMQRLEKYSTTKKATEAAGDSAKVRRLQRIVNSYEKAIKDYKAGKHVDFDELPTPPGFAPIPVKSDNKAPINTAKQEKPPEPKTNASAVISSKPVKTEGGENNIPSARKPKIQRTNTSADKQLKFLMERQKLFRQAALSAKENGDLQQAKEYLRMSKGFDSMIEATKCGLPIDASTIPTPPQLISADFEIIDVSECGGSELSLKKHDDLFETLQKDLCNQLEICNRNKEHFFQLGDVSSAAKFEKLGYETKKDLAVIQGLKKKGDIFPKFHYETRLFSMILCHIDLADNEIEVNVLRGINLPGKPDDLDSYVKVEFPIPTEAPQRQKTHTVKDTNNPTFEEMFKFEFNRKSRSHLRLFKRHSIKFEVWSKGGFLRSDSLIGTVNVKLVDLESKCLIHDSYNLMDGRKTCGGKLEIKIRIRDPLLVKQVEEVREKWLVIGS